MAAALPPAQNLGGVASVEDLPFRQLCGILAQIGRSSKRGDERFSRLLKIWSAFQHESMWPLMRLLLPDQDHERSNYGLRESKLIPLFIKACGLHPAAEDAVRLVNFKNATHHGAAAGDFPGILAAFLKNRTSHRSDCEPTLRQVNQILDRLSLAGASQASGERLAVITEMIKTFDPTEISWLVRIILKDLKIGMGRDICLKKFHPRALDIINSNSDLKKVCEAVAHPHVMLELDSAEVQIGSPFQVMRAANQPYDKIVERMRGHPFAVEPKYDGERIIIHKQGPQLRIFSRRHTDYTELYGPVLQDIMKSVFPASLNCIIDGELTTWNRRTGHFHKFGNNRTVAELELARLRGVQRPTTSERLPEGVDPDDLHLFYIAFDLICTSDVDGSNLRSLAHEPLSKRRAHLDFIVNRPLSKRFELSAQERGEHKVTWVMDCLDRHLLAGMEGIVVKRLDAPYRFNGHSPHDWIKLKSDHVEGMHETLDLIIMGGYFADSNRRAGISHFLLGVAENPPQQPASHSSAPVKFLAFGKVGSGYSMAELETLRENWKPDGNDWPDVVIPPEHSVILEIKCYELTQCRLTKFPSGWTARFPRVDRIRYDKAWHECLTLPQLLDLTRSNNSHWSTGAGEAGDDYGRGPRQQQRQQRAGVKLESDGSAMIKPEPDDDFGHHPRDGSGRPLKRQRFSENDDGFDSVSPHRQGLRQQQNHRQHSPSANSWESPGASSLLRSSGLSLASDSLSPDVKANPAGPSRGAIRRAAVKTDPEDLGFGRRGAGGPDAKANRLGKLAKSQMQRMEDANAISRLAILKNLFPGMRFCEF